MIFHRKFFLLLSFLGSLQLSAESQREQCRQDYIHGLWQKYVNALQVLRGENWHTLPLADIQSAAQHLPDGPQYPELAGWSCGPNAITRACRLIGVDPFARDQEYVDFALAAPKSVGLYTDFKDDKTSKVRNPLLSQLKSIFHGINFAFAFHGIMSLANAKVGALPDWLASYADHALSKKSVKVEALSFADFNEALENIKQGIDRESAMMPLVIFSLFEWHYLLIVAYNDVSEQVMILDIDGMFRVTSYKELHCLMNTGVQEEPTVSFSRNLDATALNLVTQFAHELSAVRNYTFIEVSKYCTGENP